MAKMYQVRPSELLNADDPYTAYCIDEACHFIRRKLEDGESPVFEHKVTSFADIYGKIGE